MHIEYVKNAAEMELAMFALDYAHRFGVDRIALISGDGDYARLVTYLKRVRVRVEVVSLPKNLSPKIDEAADDVHYLDRILALTEAPQTVADSTPMFAGRCFQMASESEAPPDLQNLRNRKYQSGGMGVHVLAMHQEIGYNIVASLLNKSR